MNFQSKKDIWLAVLIWGVIILMFFMMITEQNIVVYIVGILNNALLLWLWFGTNYKIDDEDLIVRSGPFKSTIDIKSIKKLRATKTLLAGPALSIDRIEIQYKRYDSVIVSPKEKNKFIESLLSKNKSIEVDDKLIQDN
ncbi:MAG TPA: PH domain-containing protein [Candidatus Nosocomiicoccus stercorigallinarum]|nr:PH domain-containing protein [Candidatus Nosocomiicoccus stercorigallinarum]